MTLEQKLEEKIGEKYSPISAEQQTSSPALINFIESLPSGDRWMDILEALRSS
jgi:hypothetical protein